MAEPTDIAEKIRTATVGVDLADEASFEALMEQIGELMSEASNDDGGLADEVMAALQTVLQAQSVAMQKQVGLTDEEIAQSQQMMAEYAEQAEAERAKTSPEVLAVFDAIDAGDAVALRAALDHVDVNVRVGEYEKTPLYAAMSDFDVSLDIIDILLERGADPAQGLAGDSSVLHGMAFGAYRDWPQKDVDALVARCVKAGAQLEGRTGHLGWTPLHTAISEWEEKVAHAMLINGADPNALMGVTDPPTFNNGGTPLQMVQSQPDLVELLLSFGADPLIPDAHGQTAIESAREGAQDTSSYGSDCARSLALMEARTTVN